MKITALKIQARNQARVNVYLDGKFAFGLAKIEAARLRLGQELSEADLARLKNVDDLEKAYQRALKYLNLRPRSEAEMRQHLSKHRVGEADLETILQRLRDSGLLNDQAFARLWVENRSTFRPRSKRALQAELKRKGIHAEALGDALADANDADSAYRLAQRRAPRLTALPKPEFRQKLGGYLARRGYAFDIIAPILERVWKELHTESAR
jgi:regulatory protein